MEEKLEEKSKEKYWPRHLKKNYKLSIPAFLLFVISVIVAIVALVNIVLIQRDYAATALAYEGLRKEYAPILMENGIDADLLSSEEQISRKNPAEINADYIGWIAIPGTGIDYPVAQSGDNAKYLDLSFTGVASKSGAIFMDYRCTEGFNGAYGLLYGHNMRNGTMFARLNKYLDKEYLEQNPNIVIINPDNQKITYHIFAVQNTDVDNPIYTFDYSDTKALLVYFQNLGASAQVEQVISLSTCTDGGNKNARLLVHGERI